jgi:hypothetical protein
MLDHDELLPEEQANPGLIQELQAIYLMQPEEKQVLDRVHQRLTQNDASLPLSKPVQARDQAQLLQFGTLAATPLREARARQRWPRLLNVLAAVLILGLLVGSLGFTFAMIGHIGVGSLLASPGNLRVFLVPAEQGVILSHAELETESNILSQRFSNFGLTGFSTQVTTSNGQTGILVELPHFGGNEQQTLATLVEPGKIAFWDTGQTPVQNGTVFDPTQYVQSNGGTQPLFTGKDLDPNSLGIAQSLSGAGYVITFAMQGSAITKLSTWSTHHIGDYLTITLDGNVINSEVIQSQLPGSGQIAGNFTQQQAKAIASALKSGTLPVALKQA